MYEINSKEWRDRTQYEIIFTYLAQHFFLIFMTQTTLTRHENEKKVTYRNIHFFRSIINIAIHVIRDFPLLIYESGGRLVERKCWVEGLKRESEQGTTMTS